MEKSQFNITNANGKYWGSGKIDPNSFGDSTSKQRYSYYNYNWIQGGNNITVYDGSTTVNSNARGQKTIYHYKSDDLDSTLTVKSGAKMYWNADDIWFLEQDRVKSKTWNIESKAQFIINGTKKQPVLITSGSIIGLDMKIDFRLGP